MSKAIAYLERNKRKVVHNPIQAPFSGTRWTGLIDNELLPDKGSSLNGYEISSLEISPLINDQAGALITSFYMIRQLLSQTTIASVRLFRYSPVHRSNEEDLEEDFWINMPPRSVREVVMNIQPMGRGKPLDFIDDEEGK